MIKSLLLLLCRSFGHTYDNVFGQTAEVEYQHGEVGQNNPIDESKDGWREIVRK